MTANLARSLADQAHATVHAAATIISGVAERLENDGTSDEALDRLNRLLTKFVATTSGINHLVVFSAAGDALVTSFTPMPKVNIADRDYFIYHRDHSDSRPLIGTAIRNRADGRWSFTVSRRVESHGGAFGGVVVAVVDCDAFRELYSKYDVGPRGTIWLMHDDATLMVRQPPIPGTIGRNFEQAPFVRYYREHGSVGSSQQVSSVDGVSRLSSYRKVDDYPLVVFVTVSTNDILSSWWSDATIALLASATVSAILGLFGWRLVTQFRLRDQKDAAVRESEQQYRLLADASTDVIVKLGPNGRRQYVSPACERMFGYQPIELLDGHPRDTAHPDDWPRLAACIEEILTVGQAPPVTYRVRRRDGIYLWVEIQGRRLEVGQGCVVAIRDITARKRVEALLHEANNHLQQQVMLDGLTGVANRRCFDQTFEKEFRRARRNSSPIGLLMIDVDHFKKFNDIYGHPAGDGCLRRIAETIEAQVRRPGDFVARYGGEEFAVLLPDTGPGGASEMASRITAAIERLGIVHRGNSFSVATVSIGVATSEQNHPDHSHHKLLEMADTALYQAKERGRNCVCLNQEGEGQSSSPAGALAEAGG